MNNITIHRKRNRELGISELIAISFRGVGGGGIFTVLGILISMIEVFTSLAILVGVYYSFS